MNGRPKVVAQTTPMLFGTPEDQAHSEATTCGVIAGRTAVVIDGTTYRVEALFTADAGTNSDVAVLRAIDETWANEFRRRAMLFRDLLREIKVCGIVPSDRAHGQSKQKMPGCGRHQGKGDSSPIHP